jgi:hypothetical protein
MAQKADRTRNWRKYNEALVNRGSITFWFDEDSLKNWHANSPTGKKGRPTKYSNFAITCGLTLKAIFNLTFRAVEGFIKSLVTQLKLPIETPDYTLLCKRQKSLSVALPKQKRIPNEKIQILVDTTGLKVFGEGEWKVRQHGYVKHRLWRKLHLAVNSESQEIEAFKLTDLGVQDCEGFKLLVDEISHPIKEAIGDGAFDRFSCYDVAEDNSFEMITPPQCNARTSKERRLNKKKGCKEAVERRDSAIKKVREVGLAEWKRQVGYHRRSLAETAVYRIKTLFGNRLTSKTIAHQQTEIAVWCRALNKMTRLGFGY